MMKTFVLFFTILLLASSSPLFAQSESLPESAVTLPSDSVGALYFYLKELDEAAESVHAVPKDTVRFCLKLNASLLAVSQALPYLQQVQLELYPENGDQMLKGESKLNYKGLKPNALGCYEGKIALPQKLLPGKYQVTDLDLILTKKRRFSMRETLSSFSKLATLEVEAPAPEADPIVFEKLKPYSKAQQPLKFFGNRARALIRFRVETHDANRALDVKSFKFFMKVYLDGVMADIPQAECKPTYKGIYFDCKLYFSRAKPDLKGRAVVIVPDSMSVMDVFGNVYEVKDEKGFRDLSDGELIRWVLYSEEPLSEINLYHPPVSAPAEGLGEEVPSENAESAPAQL